MDKIIEEYIKRIEEIDNVKEYDETVKELNSKLTGAYSKEFCKEIEQKQKYIKNKFSDEVDKERMFEAKERVLGCLRDFSDKGKDANKYAIDALMAYLNNFPIFMEAMRNKKPDKRATLSLDLLQIFRRKRFYRGRY